MKKLVVIALVGALSMSAFGADFSKVSNEKLIEISEVWHQKTIQIIKWKCLSVRKK